MIHDHTKMFSHCRYCGHPWVKDGKSRLDVIPMGGYLYHEACATLLQALSQGLGSIEIPDDRVEPEWPDNDKAEIDWQVAEYKAALNRPEFIRLANPALDKLRQALQEAKECGGDPKEAHLLADTALLAFVNDPVCTDLFESIREGLIDDPL